MRLLGGAEGAMGREGKGVSHLQSVADPEFVKRGHRKGTSYSYMKKAQLLISYY